MTKTGKDPYSNGPNFPLSNEKNFPYSNYAQYNLTRQFLKSYYKPRKPISTSLDLKSVNPG